MGQKKTPPRRGLSFPRNAGAAYKSDIGVKKKTSEIFSYEITNLNKSIGWVGFLGEKTFSSYEIIRLREPNKSLAGVEFRPRREATR